MTDDQLEMIVMDEIKKRQITFYDMIGLSNQNIDPDPQENVRPVNQRARKNRFNALTESGRMEELLCAGEYNPYRSLRPMKVPLQDLFRFWWNRCVIRELVVEEILEDIFTHFIEKMRPPEKKEEALDMTIDFEQLPLCTLDIEEAA
jgi:hypothetical protein